MNIILIIIVMILAMAINIYTFLKQRKSQKNHQKRTCQTTYKRRLPTQTSNDYTKYNNKEDYRAPSETK